MSKSILISIKPEYVCKILNGEKTIEIRKTMPKCELPVKVYIYCTKGEPLTFFGLKSNGFIFEKLNGKVVAEFTLNVVEDFECSSDDFRYLVENTRCCLTMEQVYNYCNGQDLYGWYIDDLKIYDKPKELSEFTTGKVALPCGYGDYNVYNKTLKRPPQSWCYCQGVEE